MRWVLVKATIYVIRFRGDDPRKSTALKLVRLGLATKVSPKQVPKNSIVLNPFSDTVLTPLDREYVIKYGLVVVDTSWNLGEEVLKNLFRRVRGKHRILPLLKAANPINYAVFSKLSSAEAVAAALYIVGLKEQANEVLSKFKWGPTFIKLNHELLEKYSGAKDVNEVLKIQDEVLRKLGMK